MKTIEVSEYALESLKAMAQKLQEQRDMLLEACKELLEAEIYADGEGVCSIKNTDMDESAKAVNKASAAIAACQESTKVME